MTTTRTALAAPDPDDEGGALSGIALPTASDRQGVPGHDEALERANAIRLLTLRAQGLTYEQIAKEVGYADGSGARQALLRALDRHETENVTQLRAIEHEAYLHDQRILRSITIDPGASRREKIAAIDARTRSAARHARLMGMDAPIAVQISAGVQAELADALAELHELVMGEVTQITDSPYDAEGPEPLEA